MCLIPKAEYAFRIYDFNEDDAIDAADIQEVVNCITGEQVGSEG